MNCHKVCYYFLELVVELYAFLKMQCISPARCRFADRPGAGWQGPACSRQRARLVVMRAGDRRSQPSRGAPPEQQHRDCVLPTSAAAIGALACQLAAAAPAIAEDVAAYDASGSSETLKNVFGAAYVAVLIGFGIRLFSKRAKWSTTEVCLPSPPPRPGPATGVRLIEPSHLGQTAPAGRCTIPMHYINEGLRPLQRLASSSSDEEDAAAAAAAPAEPLPKPSPFSAL